MALPVKNSCKPGISVTFAAPRPAAEPGQMLRAEGGCGVYWGGGFIPAPPPRQSVTPHHSAFSRSHNVPRPNGGVLTCKNMMKKGTGVKGGALAAKLWIFLRRSWGVFLGEGEGEGIDSTRMELIRCPQFSLKDESPSSSAK